MQTKNLGAIDMFRIIAAALVVAIHAPSVPFLGESGNLLLSGVIARIAVPFFFAVTGLFTDFSSAACVKRLIGKTALLYAAATAVYLPYGSYSASIKQVLFDGSFYHLWYFPALALGAVTVFALKKLPTAASVTIAAALYAFGLCGDGYRTLAENIEPLQKALDVLSKVFSYTRNGIFFAPLFLLIGNIIGNYLRSENSRSISVFVTAPCFALSLGALAVERFSLRGITFAPHDNMFVSLIPCTIFLILTLSAIKLKPLPALRQISMWIYIVHPIIIDLIIRVSNGCDKTSGTLSDDARHVIFTASVSLSAALFFGVLLARKNPRKQKFVSNNSLKLQNNLSEL